MVAWNVFTSIFSALSVLVYIVIKILEGQIKLIKPHLIHQLQGLNI